METPSYNVRSVGFWLKTPIVGPILCLALVYLVLALFTDALGSLFMVCLFAAGSVAIFRNLSRAGRYIFRR